MQDYFKENFPQDNSISRKVRIAIMAFERILNDVPGFDIPTARDMAMKIAEINPAVDTIAHNNFISRAMEHLLTQAKSVL